MSKLSEFYAHKSSLISSGEMTLAKWDALEEHLIREDVLPELLQQLRAVLCQVKSPLMLSVSYDPNGTLAVSFTRNCMQMQVPVDAGTSILQDGPAPEPEIKVIAEQEPEAKEKIKSEKEPTGETVTDDSKDIDSEDSDKQMPRSKSEGFTVKFLDGTNIHKKNAVKTFIAALQKIGLQRIAHDNHGVQHAGFNVVSTEKRETEAKKQEYVDGYYIYTNLSNRDKTDDLNHLSRYFNLNLTVVSDKSTGIAVIFPDGTTIHKKKAVKTFIAALQKIGLRRIAHGSHGVQHAGFNVVSTDKREADTEKQEYVNGYYIYTNISNHDKIDDLNKLSRFYNLNLTIVSDETDQLAVKIPTQEANYK